MLDKTCAEQHLSHFQFFPGLLGVGHPRLVCVLLRISDPHLGVSNKVSSIQLGTYQLGSVTEST